MVALIDDEMAVVADAIVDDALPDQALNHGDIDSAGWLVPAATDSPNRGRWHVQERRQPFDPLIEQLPPMNEHERVDATLGDQPGGDDGLAEGGGRGQHTGVMR